MRRPFAILGVALLASCNSAPEGKRLEALQREGDALLARIEQHAREHNGIVPASLAAAGIQAPKTRWGRWEYECRAGKAVIHVGDYSRDGFELTRESGANWYYDR